MGNNLVDSPSEEQYSLLKHVLWSTLLNYRGSVFIVMLSEYAAYFDDSGHPDDQKFVVVAGFIAEKTQWLRFEPEWKKAIAPRSTFHAADFERESKDWGRNKKERYLNRLATIIKDNTIFSLSDSVCMDEYRTINATNRLEETLGTPYAMAGRTVAAKLNAWRATHGAAKCKVLVYFEDGTKHKGDFMDVMQRDGLPCPGFLKKNDSPALQAADFLAWMVHGALQTGEVHQRLARLAGIGGPLAHGKFDEDALMASLKHLKEKHPHIEIVRRIPYEIRFHSSPKKVRRQTVKPK